VNDPVAWLAARDKLDWLVNGGGMVLIAAIIGWFWLSKPKARAVTGVEPIDIVVADGVYTPARIEVAAGQPVRLRFLRKDPSPCAEKVLFTDLHVVEELPVGESKIVTVTPPKQGEYGFTCEMQMYRGALVAK